MEKSLKVLQVGKEDFRTKYEIPAELAWETVTPGEDWKMQEEKYDIVWISSPITAKDGSQISKIGNDYRIFYNITDELKNCEVFARLRRLRIAQSILPERNQEIINLLPMAFYDGQYGDKSPIKDCEIRNENAHVVFRGNHQLVLKGDYGTTFQQILVWRYGIVMNRDRALELWLEYSIDGDLELEMVVRGYQSGSVSELVRIWRFDKELKEPWAVILSEKERNLTLSVSLRARGSGCLRIGPLHHRQSRMGTAVFLPGGKKQQDKNREEFFSLLEYGDRKPPLNVYFSGYRTAEGFEGYYMMKNLGSPFLLLGDPRLEGGAFYIGSEEYEQKIRETIQKALDRLEFTKDQLILSGISMGSFGAAYYSADFEPHSVILGKPLMNLGNVAANERYLRPGGFATSLDLLLKETGGLGPEEIEQLNQKLWRKFDKAGFENTDFVISYMKHDDYDPTGYQDLLNHLATSKANIYGKGIIGRHNDNTSAVVEWFIKRYQRIMERSFPK